LGPERNGTLQVRFEVAHVRGSDHRQTSVFDARYQGISRIEYPLHPLFGREGKVVRRVQYDFGTYLELEIDEAIVNLPHWMTRADLCERFTCGLDPVPQLDALRQILQLLDGQHR
jgi:hypothetical protein